MIRPRTPDEVKKILSFVNPRPDYETWIKIISAVGNSFPESTALGILLSRFTDEKPNEHLLKLRNRLANISLATLVYYAKQNGYTPEKTINDLPSNYKPIKLKQNPPPQIKFIDTKISFHYRFNYEIEERLAIMEHQAGLSRLEAERIVLTDTPETPKERAFRIAINNQVKNKTTDYIKLNTNFENQILTISEIAEQIGNGFSFIGAELKTDDKGKVKRNNDNWVCSELITLDIDTGLTIDEAFKIPQTKHALMIYTSPSHTPEKHRFRILFDLPYLETDQERYREIIKQFIKQYKADEQCKDLARIFFGNTNCNIYLIRTGEKLKYRNGVLQK